MKKGLLGFGLLLTMITSGSAWAQRGPSADWGQARITVRDLVEDLQQSYLTATRTDRGEVVRRIFTVWADSKALNDLIQQAPRTQQEVYEVLKYVQDDMDRATDAAQQYRLSGQARSYLMHAGETLSRLAEDLGAGGGGYEPGGPSEPYPDDALSLTLASDGWHGNFFDRYTRLSGEFKGLNLRQADLIVTDAQGYSMWHRDNAFPEIAQWYATHKYIRPAVVTIPFRMQFKLNWLPRGAAWIYVRLRDMQGNIKDEAIPVPADYTRPE